MKSTALQDQIQIASIVYDGFATACDMYVREYGNGYAMTEAYSELSHHRRKWFKTWVALRECDKDHTLSA